MREIAEFDLVSDGNEIQLEERSCHEVLRSATQEPHERLHRHSGFSAVKDGTIDLSHYRALLICLYGFHLPFEHALGACPVRTHWLERDLAWLGIDAASVASIRSCPDIPRLNSPERKRGALYVVEGSALGGRLLCRGLDRLLGRDSMEGRRFFAGREADIGPAWFGFLERLESAGAEPIGRAILASAAIETFEVFETWLAGWSAAR